MLHIIKKRGKVDFCGVTAFENDDDVKNVTSMIAATEEVCDRVRKARNRGRKIIIRIEEQYDKIMNELKGIVSLTSTSVYCYFPQLAVENKST